MKIAILYIATGRYKVFFYDFYNSVKKYFLPKSEKRFFIFTDDFSYDKFCKEDVFLVKRDAKGFPFDTLDRFDMFCGIKRQLLEFDYIFFFNANIVCTEDISDEVLPDKESESGIVCVSHPLMQKRDINTFPYERNIKSLAYIPFGTGKFYVQGAFFGGTKDAFLKMCETLSENITVDYNNAIIAIWHDESHLNKYVQNIPIKVLGLNYLCPDTAKYRLKCKHFYGNPKIILLEKNSYKYGGIDFLRGSRNSKIGIFEHIACKYLGLRKLFAHKRT